MKNTVLKEGVQWGSLNKTYEKNVDLGKSVAGSAALSLNSILES